ncbi:MAG TPA: ABC-type transport auxiliary lipoprotein family protein [Rhodanobacteraceae bacterium]|nr:ABC-type transport auxiliary lipoprotein family protein [Rhodanobacteraceae bacterium]
MKHLRLVLALCLMTLGGCGAASRQNVVPRHYTLGGASPAASQPSSNPRGAILRIAHIDMPAWLQGTGLHYRLAYRNDDVIAAYANSDWAAPPAGMLEQRLRNALAAGGWRAVVGPASTAQADFTLQVRVDDFSQLFTSPGESFGVLDATVTLVATSDAVVAQRRFRFRVAAPSPDAAGGVKALGAASRDFARQLRDWLAARQPNAS